MCAQQSCWGESAANSVQLVGEAAEAVMPGLSILVLFSYEANTQDYCPCLLGTCRRAVLVAQKIGPWGIPHTARDLKKPKSLGNTGGNTCFGPSQVGQVMSVKKIKDTTCA